MFEKIAELNRSLHGKGANVLILNSELQAVQQNFCHGQKVLSKDAQICLQCLNDFITANEFSLFTSVKWIVLGDTCELHRFSDKYFPRSKSLWCCYIDLFNIIHHPFFFFYLNVSETGFFLYIQIKTSQLGPVDTASPHLQSRDGFYLKMETESSL
jgi:hypothetical protein